MHANPYVYIDVKAIDAVAACLEDDVEDVRLFAVKALPLVAERGDHTAGLFIHTFEIKSNLILISNPIMAYAYQKQRKT